MSKAKKKPSLAVVGATVIVPPVVAATAATSVADALVVNVAGRSPPPVNVTTAVPFAAIAVPVFTTRKKYVPLSCAEAEPNEVIADPAAENPSNCVTAVELSVMSRDSFRPRIVAFPAASFIVKRIN
jgi:hypothetical protein